MGKIKQKLVRRTAKTLGETELPFNDKFEQNKKILGKEMPSKKIRNQIAGLMAREKRKQKEEYQKLHAKK